jgi:hypothetical protein
VNVDGGVVARKTLKASDNMDGNYLKIQQLDISFGNSNSSSSLLVGGSKRKKGNIFL